MIYTSAMLMAALGLGTMAWMSVMPWFHAVVVCACFSVVLTTIVLQRSLAWMVTALSTVVIFMIGPFFLSNLLLLNAPARFPIPIPNAEALFSTIGLGYCAVLVVSNTVMVWQAQRVGRALCA